MRSCSVALICALVVMCGAVGADTRDVSLLQVQSKHVVQKQARIHDVPAIHDHMHIVCHSEGCKEVHARLELTQKAVGIAQEKLEQCATARQKLSEGLEKAAKMRAKAWRRRPRCG